MFMSHKSLVSFSLYLSLSLCDDAPLHRNKKAQKCCRAAHATTGAVHKSPARISLLRPRLDRILTLAAFVWTVLLILSCSVLAGCAYANLCDSCTMARQCWTTLGVLLFLPREIYRVLRNTKKVLPVYSFFNLRAYSQGFRTYEYRRNSRSRGTSFVNCVFDILENCRLFSDLLIRLL